MGWYGYSYERNLYEKVMNRSIWFYHGISAGMGNPWGNEGYESDGWGFKVGRFIGRVLKRTPAKTLQLWNWKRALLRHAEWADRVADAFERMPTEDHARIAETWANVTEDHLGERLTFAPARDFAKSRREDAQRFREKALSMGKAG